VGEEDYQPITTILW